MQQLTRRFRHHAADKKCINTLHSYTPKDQTRANAMGPLSLPHSCIDPPYSSQPAASVSKRRTTCVPAPKTLAHRKT